MQLRILTWNLDRSSVRGKWRALSQKQVLEAKNPDIAVLTETHEGFNLAGLEGRASSDPGKPPAYLPSERAAVIRSRWPCVETFATGDARTSVCRRVLLPNGHGLWVYALVLPYAADGVREGFKTWERHQQAVRHLVADLAQIRSRFSRDAICVAGDFNMNLDGTRWYGNPAARAELLEGLKSADMRCATTADLRAAVGRATVDHICLSSHLRPGSEPVGAWPGIRDGARLSDHNGVWVDVGVGVEADVDAAIEQIAQRFQDLIRQTCGDGADRGETLPNATSIHEAESSRGWFHVAGYACDFSFRLSWPDDSPILSVTCSSKFIGDSTRHYKISPDRCVLTGEGDDAPELQNASG